MLLSMSTLRLSLELATTETQESAERLQVIQRG